MLGPSCQLTVHVYYFVEHPVVFDTSGFEHFERTKTKTFERIVLGMRYLWVLLIMHHEKRIKRVIAKSVTQAS